MGKSSSNPLRVQRILWLLQYLRKHSAPGHPVKLRDIDLYFQAQGMELAVMDKKKPAQADRGSGNGPQQR